MCDDCNLNCIHDFYGRCHCIIRFMVWFYLGYFVGAMCRKTLVFRRILFKCKSSSVTTCFAANSPLSFFFFFSFFFGDLNGF